MSKYILNVITRWLCLLTVGAARQHIRHIFANQQHTTTTSSPGQQSAVWYAVQQWQQLLHPLNASQQFGYQNRNAATTYALSSRVDTDVSSLDTEPQAQQQQLLHMSDALSPPGGLPLSVTQTLNLRLLFMAAIADFAYVKEFGSSKFRQDCGPCLRQWGAQGEPVVVDSVDAAGGVSHCTVFRTNYDMFLIFRGLDELKSIPHIEMDTAHVYAAAYFGMPNNPSPKANGRMRGSRSTTITRNSTKSNVPDGSSVDDFYVLQGFLRAHQLGPIERLKYRIWIIGHSDGSSLAQLAALRLSFTMGADKIGGVVLFGTQRVGSPAFADYYNGVLGNQTVRVQYGWDPATEFQYPASDGLKTVGKGYTICPVPGSAVEKVVEVPVGVDVPLACGQPTPGSTEVAASDHAHAISSEARAVSELQQAVCSAIMSDAAAARARGHIESSSTTYSSSVAGIPGATGLYWLAAVNTAAGETLAALTGSSYHNRRVCNVSAAFPAARNNGVLDVRFLAHHMPAIIYDGILRVLGDKVDNNTLAALQLPLCAVSDRCAAALRQDATKRCHTCSATETCTQYWHDAGGVKCDDKHPWWSGYLCYNSYFAPGLLGLFGFLGNKPSTRGLETYKMHHSAYSHS